MNTILLHEITVRIVDQDGNLINIPEKRKFCSLKMKQVENMWKEFKQRFGKDTTTTIQLMQMAKI